jgi:hypothetical protein
VKTKLNSYCESDNVKTCLLCTKILIPFCPSLKQNGQNAVRTRENKESRSCKAPGSDTKNCKKNAGQERVKIRQVLKMADLQ